MKRVLLLATVAALMAVMLVVSVAPVSAHSVTCVGGPRTGADFDVAPNDPLSVYDDDGDGVICHTAKHDGTLVYRDDHGFPNGH